MTRSLKLYKDKDKALKARNRWRKNNYTKGRKYSTSKGKRYTIEEVKLVLDHSIPDIELAKLLKRSVQSIQTKRSELKHSV